MSLTTLKHLRARRPRYHESFRELWADGHLVKRFRQPAKSQDLLLRVFEEERWKRLIDDPLPPIAGKSPKRHLHDTIANLNRHQATPLLRFFGDGTGTKVGWDWR